MTFLSALTGIFSLRPPSSAHRRLHDLQPFTAVLPDPNDPNGPTAKRSALREFTREKIRFDNAFRLGIACFTLLVCFGMWLGELVQRFSPFAGLFLMYGVMQFSASRLSFLTRYPRGIEFFIAGMDLFAITMAIQYSGAKASPLSILYFCPLMVQAFHRDWTLVLVYGIGSVAMYVAVVLSALPAMTMVPVAEVVARAMLMLLTLTVTAFAVNLLRKKDEHEQARLSRMKTLNAISELLHQVASINDLAKAVAGALRYINEELADRPGAWCRVLLTEHSGERLTALSGGENSVPDLKQEIPADACPALSENRLFQLADSEKDLGCPAESFAFHSHVCLPICGADGVPNGVLFSGSHAKNAFGEEEIQFLSFAAKSLGLTIQRLRKGKELSLALEMDSCAMASFVGSTKNLESTLRSIMDGTRSLVSADQVSVMLWEPLLGVLMTKAANGPAADQERRVILQMGEGISGRALETGEPQTSSNLLGDPAYREGRLPFKSVISLPMRSVKGEPMGVLNAWSSVESKLYSSTEIETAATFAARAAIAIENALFHEQQREIIASLQPGDQAKAA